MKYFLPFIFCLLFIVSNAQFKTISLLDFSTHQPIEFASVYLKHSADGSISNADGFIQLNLSNSPQDDTIEISHINYSKIILSLNEFLKKDTIYLNLCVYNLPEIVISNFNLKSKLEYVLDHFDELYVDYPTLKECTYKEVFKANGKTKRLITADIGWWSKSSKYIFNQKKMSDFCDLALKNVSASKIQNISNSLNGKGTLSTKDLVNRLYLNYVLEGILENSSDMKIVKFEENTKELNIEFETDETPLKDVKNETVIFTGRCIFNKGNKALAYLSLNSLFSNSVHVGKGMDDGSINYKSHINSMSHILAFVNSIDGKKLSLSYMQLTTKGTIEVQNEGAFEIMAINNLYITKESRKNGLRSKKPIDIRMPIYKAVPTNETTTNTIQLSKEEIDFVNEKQQ